MGSGICIVVLYLDRVRPSLVAGNGQQSQAPPPYYAENKALEHSLDHALAMEDSKTPAYSQPGYGYHQPNHNINGEWKLSFASFAPNGGPRFQYRCREGNEYGLIHATGAHRVSLLDKDPRNGCGKKVHNVLTSSGFLRLRFFPRATA